MISYKYFDKWYHTVFLWLISLSIMPSKSMLLQIIKCNSFFINISIVYIYQIFFIHKSIDGYLDCFHILAILHLFYRWGNKDSEKSWPKYTLLIHFRAGFKPNLCRLCSLSSKSTTVMFRWEQFVTVLKEIREIIQMKALLGFENSIEKN